MCTVVTPVHQPARVCFDYLELFDRGDGLRRYATFFVVRLENLDFPSIPKRQAKLSLMLRKIPSKKSHVEMMRQEDFTRRSRARSRAKGKVRRRFGGMAFCRKRTPEIPDTFRRIPTNTHGVQIVDLEVLGSTPSPGTLNRFASRFLYSFCGSLTIRLMVEPKSRSCAKSRAKPGTCFQSSAPIVAKSKST